MDKKVLISKVDGGYVVDTNWPFAERNSVHLALPGVINKLREHFGVKSWCSGFVRKPECGQCCLSIDREA